MNAAIPFKSATFLLLFGLVLGLCPPGFATEYEVPNTGSPYVNLDDLEENQILHLPTGVTVSRDQLIEAISGSRVIYIGESHDNLEAHRVQLDVIRGLHEKFPGRIAIGMEMFRRSAQPGLDRWHQGESTDTEFKKLFRQHWGSGYEVYQPIFEFAQQQRIPLLGLKSTTEAEGRLRAEGPGAEGLPEMDLDDPYHKALTMAVFGGHQTEGLSKPYQMLLLWEETMAQSVAEFLRDDSRKDWKLVVLAGGFHVQYGFGIPKRAFRRVPHPYTILLPTATELPEELKATHEMDVEPVAIPLYSADYIWKVSYTVPPKNKIRLGVMLAEEAEGVRVRSVQENSNADRAGILKDDILLRLDGEPLTGVGDLVDRLQNKNYGDTVRITLRRGDEEHSLNVHLQKPDPPLK